MAMSQSNMTEFKMAAIIKLSQIEWVKCFCGNGGNQSWQVWVSLKGNTKIAESKMVKFKMAEFKMAAIIKLNQNEWVKFFCANGANQSWQVWVTIERKYYHGWIQDGQILDGCHHQVKWEWMSLSQIELVWVRVRVEWECFWVNLREDNKVSESKMAVS